MPDILEWSLEHGVPHLITLGFPLAVLAFGVFCFVRGRRLVQSERFRPGIGWCCIGLLCALPFLLLFVCGIEIRWKLGPILWYAVLYGLPGVLAAWCLACMVYGAVLLWARRYRRCSFFFGLAATVLVLIPQPWILMSAESRRVGISSCKGDLEKLSAAIIDHRKASDGLFPSELAHLDPSALVELNTYRCYDPHPQIGDGRNPDRLSTRDYAYVYRQPRNAKTNSRTPIPWDKHPHGVRRFLWFKSKYRNVLFHDGRVETLSEGQFRREVGGAVGMVLGPPDFGGGR